METLGSGDEGLAEGVDVQQRADERARAVPGWRLPCGFGIVISYLDTNLAHQLALANLNAEELQKRASGQIGGDSA